jgi:hypothetical protein
MAIAAASGTSLLVMLSEASYGYLKTRSLLEMVASGGITVARHQRFRSQCADPAPAEQVVSATVAPPMMPEGTSVVAASFFNCQTLCQRGISVLIVIH